MAKIISKGTSLLQEITAVYTAMPQLTSLDISGQMTETYDSTTLDGIAFKTKAPTGYVEPPEISWEMFYDPDDTVQTAFSALCAVPVVTNFKVTYVDTTPTSAIYIGVGFGIDKKITPADGVKASCKIICSGAPS